MEKFKSGFAFGAPVPPFDGPITTRPSNGLCCLALKSAMEDGTDNEGYEAAVFRGLDGSLLIDSGLEPINFCPWCGFRVAKA